jgi:hypothetical protein
VLDTCRVRDACMRVLGLSRSNNAPQVKLIKRLTISAKYSNLMCIIW